MKIPQSMWRITAGHMYWAKPSPFPLWAPIHTGCVSFFLYVKQITLAHKEGFYILSYVTFISNMFHMYLQMYIQEICGKSLRDSKNCWEGEEPDSK